MLEVGDKYEKFLESSVAACHSVGIYVEPILCCLDQDTSHMESAMTSWALFQAGSGIVDFSQNCRMRSQGVWLPKLK